MMIIYIAVATAIVCFILYALDRRSKTEPIDWFTAGKLTAFGGLLAGGIAYVTTSTSPKEVVETLNTEIPIVQEMFVGNPTF